MSESDESRALPERGQRHFEWVPDEPIERAIERAEAICGKRGQAIGAVWAAARRHGEMTRQVLGDGRAVAVYPHPRVPEWHIVVELAESEERPVGEETHERERQ